MIHQRNTEKSLGKQNSTPPRRRGPNNKMRSNRCWWWWSMNGCVKVKEKIKCTKKRWSKSNEMWITYKHHNNNNNDKTSEIKSLIFCTCKVFSFSLSVTHSVSSPSEWVSKCCWGFWCSTHNPGRSARKSKEKRRKTK